MVTYHTHAEIIQMYKDLCDLYPEWCEYVSLGKTYNDNHIWMFKVGTSGATNKVLFDVCLHGWEDIGAESGYLFLDWLLTSNDAKAKQILKRNYILAVPVVNYDSDSRGNANYGACPVYGVDLNRNFNSGWGTGHCGDTTYGCAYSSSLGPGNEPETRVMATVFTEIAPQVYINCHYGGGPTLYAGSESEDYENVIGQYNEDNLLDHYTKTMYVYNNWGRSTAGGGQSVRAAYYSGVTVAFNLEHYSRNVGLPGYCYGSVHGMPWPYNPPYAVVKATLLPVFKSFMFAACQFCESDPKTVSWYDTDWAYRKKITLNDDYISGNLYHFPFYYRISGVTGKAAVDATDIVFTDSDGSTRLPHDIDTYSNGTGSIWIRIPTLANATSGSIYMYYGNDDGIDQTNIDGYKPSSVWDDYAFVCHMNDYQDNQHLQDISKYNTTITKKYANKPYMVKTTLGSGQFFKYTDNTIVSSATGPQFNMSIYPEQYTGNGPWQIWNHTISAWIKKGTCLNTTGCIVNRASSSTSDTYPFNIYTTSVETAPSQITADISTSQSIRTMDGTGFIDEEDAYFTMSIGSGSYYRRFFRNGRRLINTWAYEGILFSSAGDFNIGNNKNLTCAYSGQIDEVRLTYSYRQTGWVLTEYYNISSAGNGFYTVGLEENAPQESPPAGIVSNIFIGDGELRSMAANRILGFIRKP